MISIDGRSGEGEIFPPDATRPWSTRRRWWRSHPRAPRRDATSASEEAREGGGERREGSLSACRERSSPRRARSRLAGGRGRRARHRRRSRGGFGGVVAFAAGSGRVHDPARARGAVAPRGCRPERSPAERGNSSTRCAPEPPTLYPTRASAPSPHPMLPIRPHARRRPKRHFRSPVTRFFSPRPPPLVARARPISPPLTVAPSRAPLSFDSSQSQVFRGASRADKGKQLELGCDPRLGQRSAILEVVGESLEHFSAVNAVTALYRIARSLTSRAGRLRPERRRSSPQTLVSSNWWRL